MNLIRLRLNSFSFILIHLRPDCHYTPVRPYRMPKASHGGFAHSSSSYFNSALVKALDNSIEDRFLTSEGDTWIPLPLYALGPAVIVCVAGCF